MLNRRASDLSLNIIIMAVILLVVLAVILGIFLNRNRDFVAGVQSCAGRGGTCATGSLRDAAGNIVCEPGQAMVFDTDCSKGQVAKTACCIPIEQ
jgi:hypothetical protein